MKNRLKVLRAEKNLTQEDLAGIIGVSRQTINAIEKEKFDPSLPTAFRISRLFELPIEAIFTFEDKQEPGG
jgi:putative transcriptional regulator